MQTGSETALIVVPQDAANSMVGFKMEGTILNEGKINLQQNVG